MSNEYNTEPSLYAGLPAGSKAIATTNGHVLVHGYGVLGRFKGQSDAVAALRQAGWTQCETDENANVHLVR